MNELLNANVLFLKQDYAAAAAAYQALVRQRQDPTAACNLGFLYQQGLGVERDYQKAMRCYRASCYEDGGAGYFNLSLMYQRGLGVPVDLEESFRLMEKSANLGCADAQLFMALVQLLQYYYDPIEIECVSLIPFYHVVHRCEYSVPLLGDDESAEARKIEDERFELVQREHLDEGDAGSYYSRLIHEHKEDIYAERQVAGAKFMLGKTYIEGIRVFEPARGYKLIAEAAMEGLPEAASFLLEQEEAAKAYGVKLPAQAYLQYVVGGAPETPRIEK